MLLASMTHNAVLSNSFFKAAQNPRAWLYSPAWLCDAAEARRARLQCETRVMQTRC